MYGGVGREKSNVTEAVVRCDNADVLLEFTSHKHTHTRARARACQEFCGCGTQAYTR